MDIQLITTNIQINHIILIPNLLSKILWMNDLNLKEIMQMKWES